MKLDAERFIIWSLEVRMEEPKLFFGTLAGDLYRFDLSSLDVIRETARAITQEKGEKK